MITRNKAGMTLIEVMITIAIIIIGMEGFTILLLRTWKHNSYTLEMGQASLAVSRGINKMVGYIRGARQADNGGYPVGMAGDNELVIYSDYDKDGDTERLHFYKSGQNVLMGVRNPSGGMPVTYAAGDEEVITIADNIVNTSGEPIFFYYNQDYPGDTAGNPLSTPASVSNVRLVKIYLKINIDPNNAPDNIEMQTFVEMRNLNDYDQT